MTDDVARRVISLPMFDTVTREDVVEVATVMNREMAKLTRPSVQVLLRSRPSRADALMLEAAAGH